MRHTITPSDLQSLLNDGTPITLLDVRRAGARAADPVSIPGAEWRDPDAVEDWSRALAPDRAVVVYCVHGHEVGRGVADALRAKGFESRTIEGGLEGWKAAGGGVVT